MGRAAKDPVTGVTPQGFYVYALIDPRGGQAFYIGKGCRRRAWQHEALVRRGGGENAEKTERIRSILSCGLSVVVSVMVDGLSEEDALLREAAEIKNGQGLTNCGFFSGRRGEKGSRIRAWRKEAVDAIRFIRRLKSPKRIDDECRLYEARGQHDVAEQRWRDYKWLFECANTIARRALAAIQAENLISIQEFKS